MSKLHTPVFRTAISGFNKTDVNMYIAKLARDFGEQKAELEEKASRTDAVLAELESANAANAALAEQLPALKAENERIKAENERMKAQLSDVSALLENALNSIKTALSDTDN